MVLAGYIFSNMCINHKLKKFQEFLQECILYIFTKDDTIPKNPDVDAPIVWDHIYPAGSQFIALMKSLVFSTMAK